MCSVGNFDFEFFGKRIYDGRADTVQTARDLISAAAEFSARVQNCKYNLNRRYAFLGVNTDRNTTAVIGYRYGIVGIYVDLDFGTVAGKRLIYGVVHNFINKMVQTCRRSRPDIHSGTFSNCFKSFKNLNLTRVIFCFNLFHFLSPDYIIKFSEFARFKSVRGASDDI